MYMDLNPIRLKIANFNSWLIVPNRFGSVLKDTSKVLAAFNIQVDTWIKTIQHFRRQYAHFTGSKASLMKYAHEHNHSCYKGCA